MADSEGCEKNPFARDVFKAKGSLPANLSEIEKNRLPIGSVISDMHSQVFEKH